MGVDVRFGRRTNYEECFYWVRDEDEATGDLNQWIMKRQKKGVFYAKEVNSLFNQGNPQANVIMLDKNTISLETDDIVEDLERGCVVLYNGKPWIVDSVMRELHRKESQFDSEKYYKTIINIRRQVK